MKKILFTDTHFGVKNNSITWLNSQLDFIYKQLIPYIEKQKEPILLIHLGDVFDSRSSISPLVASKVIDAFRALSFKVERFIIIGGNHDYYSPNSDQIDSLNLLFSKLDVDLVTNDIQEYDHSLFIPWYEWGKPLKLDGINNIFTHADIVNELVPYNNVKIWSGHVHIPEIKDNLYNIGSCYALNFADANQKRGFYVVDDDCVEFIPNEHSLKFWRLYDGEIFDFQGNTTNDYIEIYIKQDNTYNPDYMKRIEELADIYKHIWVIPKNNEYELGSKLNKFEGYDITTITNDLIPEHLKEKFEMVVKNIE